MTLAQRLVITRKQFKYSQKEIAHLLRITPSTYSNYENGIYPPSLEKCITLANHYQISLDHLVGRTNIPIDNFKLETRLKNSPLLTDILDILFSLSQPELEDTYQYISFIKHQNKLSAVAEDTFSYLDNQKAPV
ncbi:MAG: helix-turn-helix transcriptional regulator [Lachnospiraceae bacterium]